MEPLLALLLSTDSGSLSVVRKVLEGHRVVVRVASSPAAANQLIKTTKFDLGIYDDDVPGALDLLEGRSAIANPKMIFVLVRCATLNHAAGKRVHFLMQKPFSAELFARSLRAAYGTMVRDRRTSFRHQVRILPRSASLVQEKGNQRLHETTILDLSQTGMCIQTLEVLPEGATLEIEFPLPDGNESIHATGSVVWTRASGRTGLRFTHIAAAEQKNLTSWLNSLLPCEIETIPRSAPRQERTVLEMQI
jgi:DNA-binding response OmpR family regulator